MNISELTKPARPPPDFDRINAAALANLPALLSRWLPDGKTNKRGEFWPVTQSVRIGAPGRFA